ncbi:hypothetical protein HYC85_023386 [Camellia sinensis]|uniref:Uncharacterized protein n=1 Tax=Camellia sinensis TaxID=4442 RepID=A0A7J7GF45_CAMSI|nr:hypothetical protein HYC85_023386 [Camellia sinensis]
MSEERGEGHIEVKFLTEGEGVFYFPQGHIEQDNGRGMPHDDIPNMFGRVLSGTKYGLKQTRGKFGLGAKMLTARRCQECGQTLPPTYQLPADEDWSTGIFGCTKDTDSLIGLFCPCVLFGRNVENLNADISQRAACVGHIICVEGGMTFAALTTVLNGIDPQTLFLIYEGLFFAWWMCGIYTSMARQSLEKKYHLKVI